MAEPVVRIPDLVILVEACQKAVFHRMFTKEELDRILPSMFVIQDFIRVQERKVYKDYYRIDPPKPKEPKEPKEEPDEIGEIGEIGTECIST